MSNEYYDHGTFPSPNTKITSAAMRAELDAIEAGFNKLPVLAGNGGEIVTVKEDGSGLESKQASDARTALGLGTLATQNANNVALTGGSINNTPIGGTTPAAGSFTTLSASGTISGPASSFLFAQDATTANLQAGAGNKLRIGTSGAADVEIYSNGVTRGAFSSTGLSVTGGLTTTGNVGIGATSGNQRLVLKGGDTNTAIYLENGSTSVGYFGVAKGYNSAFSATDILVGGYSNNTIFANGGAERARIDNNGNWLVGTTGQTRHAIAKASGAEASEVLLVGDGVASWSYMVQRADNNLWNAANVAVKVASNSTTGRSINAAGTINASGADYAEYERNNGLKISKGSVVGFKADGTLTLTYSEAIRFGVKSTDPSYVGGDVWGSEDQVGKRPEQPIYTAPSYTGPQEPVKPSTAEGEEINVEADDAEYLEALNAYQEAQAEYKAAVEAAEAAHAEAMAQYEADKAAFEERLEAARQLVDRIAYSGKVPVNVTGATPGGYIIAAEDEAGEIIGEFVADPDFSQYKRSVGRVNRILEDGRCEVAVIVH